MTTELYKRFRPDSIKKMIGQQAVRKTIYSMLKADEFPHCVLFHGPTGCGKTTLARCIKSELKIDRINFTEMNAATSRGIDTARDVENRMKLSAAGGGYRMWLIDECHHLTKDAQTGLLKPMEDTPPHVYLIFCTSDPTKLLPTFRGRCTDFALNLLSDAEIGKLLEKVSEQIEFELPDVARDEIIRCSEGSARRALVFLDAIKHTDDEKTMIDMIYKADSKTAAIEIARKLLQKDTDWCDITPILKEYSDDPENARHVILGYAKTCLLSGNEAIMDRAYAMIESFRDNFYDSKMAGLVSACYDLVNGGKD